MDAWNIQSLLGDGGAMDQEMQRCQTCPAFCAIARTDAGTCHAAPPTVVQGEAFFRGPTRELPFGAFPMVGAFPLVKADDYCMSHPGNRVKLM